MTDISLSDNVFDRHEPAAFSTDGEQTRGIGQAFESLLKELISRAHLHHSLDRSLRSSDEAPLLDVEIDGMRIVVVPVSAATKGTVKLSPREHQVAALVAEGFTNHRIAEQLGISAWTVSTHLRRMFNKLDVTNRAALVSAVGDSISPSVPRQRARTF